MPNTTAPSNNTTNGITNTTTVSIAPQDDVSLQLYVTDGKIAKEVIYLKVTKQTIDSELLSALRILLAGNTEYKTFGLLKFCSVNGAVVPDTYTIKEYVTDCVKADLTTSPVKIYLQAQQDPVQAEAKQIGQYMDANKLALLKQHFDENAFKLLTGTSAKYPAELEEQEWSVIADNNSLCYGISVIRRKEGNDTVAVGVERARYPAFRLKKRSILSDQLTSTSVKDVELFLRIPDYTVDDKSYVSIYETKSDLQSSLATSSFSQFDVSVAGSGSMFGCTMSASASYGGSSSNVSTSTSSTSSKRVTIAYNFPRVTLLLDEGSLELTKECEEALLAVVDKVSLTSFLENFGEFFSTRVQLGGRLFATEDVLSTGATASSEMARSMKASAAVAFSGWGASAAASASYGSSATASGASIAQNSTSSMTWQANGGDTLLCSSPTLWSPTVAYHWNWRITKQDQVTHMVDKIKRFSGYEGISAKISALKEEIEKEKTFGDLNQLYLNAEDGYPQGRFLALCKDSEINLMDVASAYNKSSSKKIEMATVLGERGAAVLGPRTPIRDMASLGYEVCSVTDSSRASQVCYDTKYYLRSRSGGQYLDFNDNTKIMYAATSREAVVMFKDAAGASKTGPIPNESKVVIDMYYDRTSTKPEGRVYVAVGPIKTNDHCYMMVGKPPQSALVFVMTNQYYK
ncbi:hypothetical protein BKA67DRAFT_649933 [Truncatella angustata]|uniref:MACPF domain-containing protein n=1 Tax=Truncatella angustata TaxID=152316 RepID=A0A9P8U9T9_9PEZI|nr:uncharacterized protein BKA67DRAFT_649933 [Truncatella angustata]KAH6646669.1 hypothetical protein BKA67DRAFT_649933 [Truncatella angustata]